VVTVRQAVTEFMDQARLPEAGLARNEHDLAPTGGRLVESLAEELQLRIPADVRAQPVLGGDVDPGAETRGPDRAEDVDRLGLVLDRSFAQVLEDEVPLGETMRGIAHDDRSRLGDPLHTGGRVRRVADRLVRELQIRADRAEHDEAAVDTDAEPEIDPSLTELLLERPEIRLDREAGEDRPCGVVLVGDRCSEEGEHAVAEDLRDGSLEPMDRIQDHVEEATHERADLFGVEPLRERGGTDHVGEQHADLLPFALERVRPGPDLLRESFGGVYLTRAVRRVLGNVAKRRAALHAEGAGRRVAMPARRTGELEARTAPAAELGARRIRRPAVRTGRWLDHRRMLPAFFEALCRSDASE
jgi:hypothetical protein